MKPHHNPLIQKMIALLMGLVAVCWSVRASAEETPDEIADRFKTVCATAKAHPGKDPTEEELRDCYDNELVARNGLTFETICKNLCPGSDIKVITTPEPATASAKPVAPSNPPAPRKLTAEEKCHAQHRIYVTQPVPDVFGKYTGLTQEVCLGQKELAERVLKIEETLRNLPPSGPAPVAVSQDAEAVCPTIPGKPNATLRERCDHSLFLTNQLAQMAFSRAQAAEGEAQRANQRVDEANGHLNDIVSGVVRLPPSIGRNPHFLASVALPFHVRNDFRERFVGAAGPQMQGLFDITPDLEFAILAGGGMGLGGGSDKGVVGWGGLGLLGSASTTLKVEGLFIGEQRFRKDSLTFFGPRLGVDWFPGFGSRRGFDPVLGVGAHGAIGESIGPKPNGSTRGYLDGMITLELTVFGL